VAFRHGKNAALAFNAVQLGAFGNEGSINLDIDTSETSAFGQNWKSYLSGQGGGTVTFSGHYDPAAGGPGPTITPRLFSDSTAFVFYPGGNTSGQTSWTGTCIVTNYTESASTTDRVNFSVTLQTTGTVTPATVP
jgi:predicted secreted protein